MKRREDASLIMARYRPLADKWRGSRIAWQSTGSNAIAYSKRQQAESKASFAQNCGCDFTDMRIMPATFRVKDPKECERFAAYSATAGAASYSYLAKKSASGHGIGNAKAQFLPHAIEWVWKGYGSKRIK